MHNNILITGVAGFIGSNLCLKLLKEDSNSFVIGVDNFISGSETNIKDIQKEYPDRFMFINQDICSINAHNFGYKVSEIYNAACPASPPFYQYNSLETIKTCSQGIFNLLDIANRDGAKLLQFSTSEVYGNPLVHPQVEDYFGNVNPNGPRACYDEGKRLAETICLNYNKTFGTKISIIRIFNTYGPRMRADDGRVISNFINQVINDEPITMYGTGNQTRSFCYIDDLVDGIIKAMKSDEIYPINLGNPNEFSLNELVLELEKIFKFKLKIVYKELPQDDPEKRRPDITRAKNILNWEPKVPLSEGLLYTIKYFEEHKNEN